MRVLVANRGEIAVRIIKACRALGIQSVAAVSEADKESLAARMADRAICIGPPRPADSYLNIPALIAAALGTGADAIHPGYGFLAEQPELAEACSQHGLKFIGPKAETIRQLGNKILARKIVRGYGIPVIPGVESTNNLKEALAGAAEIGFPLLLKAAAGGGGRGIRIATRPEEMKSAFETATNEARVAFGDGTLYIERYIPNARHIEVQVLGDSLGNVIHVGERDCSLQRRHQKIIEEAPAPFISNELKKEIRDAGASIARSVRYESAGTVEFILDRDSEQFYFLEVNTRIQVEHPVTEMISGLDIVQEQLRIASGCPLSLSQSEVSFTGHAIECRVNAECPEAAFRPCPGRITEWVAPQGPGIRVDTHCYAGYFVPPYYDSLLAKVIASGANRNEAIERMQQALKSFVISGIDTVIPFLLYLISRDDYVEGKVNTKWVERILESQPTAQFSKT